MSAWARASSSLIPRSRVSRSSASPDAATPAPSRRGAARGFLPALFVQFGTLDFQGVAADLDAITRECHSHGLKLLEDCAEAVGATYHGKSVGTYGDCAIFSFQYHKFMTSGEGGMVLARATAAARPALSDEILATVRDHLIAST